MITEWEKENPEIVRVVNVLSPDNYVRKVKSVALITLVDNPRIFADKLLSKAKLASINTKQKFVC